MIPQEMLEKFSFALRQGFTSLPSEGERTSTDWWVELANHGDVLQRVSAFMVLLQANLGVEVRLIEEADNGVVERDTGR